MAHCSVMLFHVSSLHLLLLYSTHFTLKQPRNIWSVGFCKCYWQASVIMKFGKRLFTKIDYKYCRNLSTQKNGLFILINNQLLCHFLLAGWLHSQDMKVMLNLKFSCCCLLLLSCSQLASWHLHVFLHFTLAVSLGRGHGGLHSLLLQLRRLSSGSTLRLSHQRWTITWSIRTLIFALNLVFIFVLMYILKNINLSNK